jgi:hypothetical protein
MHQRALARTHHCEALTLLKRTRRGLGPQALFRAAKLRRCAVNEDGSRLEVIAKGVVEKSSDAPDLEPVTVMFDFVHPLRAGGRFEGARRDAGSDEGGART